ncbi:MAG: HEAT repeat domain-containing protein [Promethearchaeota archaeon]
MALLDIIIPVSYVIVFILVFFFGFMLVYKNLNKVNTVEGEKFVAEDWISCTAFGFMFALVLIFILDIALLFLLPLAGMTNNFPIAGYCFVVLLGILIIYPLWEVFFLGRPTSDSVHDLHKFLESKILDKFRGKTAYFVSFLIFLVMYIVPIFVLNLIFPDFEFLEIGFVWFLIFPLFFLSYFAASGTMVNIIGMKYTHSFNKAISENQKKPLSPINKIMNIIFILIAWVPFILAIYNIYGGVSSITDPDIGKTGVMALLSLFTTVVFGIQGFFKRFWNKKSKTKVIDFIFSGYIFIGIGLTMLINFSAINENIPLEVFRFLPALIPIMKEPLIILPLIIIQSVVSVVYGSILYLNKKSDFHADIRLSRTISAYGEINIEELAGLTKKKKKKKAYDFLTLYKSLLLKPEYNEYGVDLNQAVRFKAGQNLFLIAEGNQKSAKKIVEFVFKSTILPSKPTSGKKRKRIAFVSKEGIDLLGEIGEIYPDLVMDRLINALDYADVQLQRYILDALGDIGESEENLGHILKKIQPFLRDRRYEVRYAALLAITEMVLEGDSENKEFVNTALSSIYNILEDYENVEAIDTALDALVKMCAKIPENVNIDRIIPFMLLKPLPKNENTVNFIIQNAINIIAYIVYYNLDKFPLNDMKSFLKDDKNFIRYSAADALGNYILKYEEAGIDERTVEEIVLDLMEHSLNDEDPDVNEMCTESIAEFLITHRDYEVMIDTQKISILKYYTSALNSSNQRMVENASEALKSIAPLFEEDILPILEENIRGENLEVVRDCMHTLGLSGEKIQKRADLSIIYERVEHEDPSIRGEAVLTLGLMAINRQDIDEKIITKCLDDDDPQVRQESIFALGKIGQNQKSDEITSILIEKFFEIDRESEENVSEVELYAESLGEIGKVHPSNEIIIVLQNALMGGTNIFAKDVIARSLWNIGNGMIHTGNATRMIENEEFYNQISWLQAVKKEYTIGNLIIIMIEALQQKGIPESVMNIISDSIQDLLPVFLFVKQEKKPDEILNTVKFLLAQAYYSNYNREILETIDRIDSMLTFKRSFEVKSERLINQFIFYAKQYTPDGLQWHDQAEVFLLLEPQTGDPKFLDYALRSFEIATQLAPHEYYTADCHFKMGEIYEKEKKYIKAKEKFEIAYEVFTSLDEIESMKDCEEHLEKIKQNL